VAAAAGRPGAALPPCMITSTRQPTETHTEADAAAVAGLIETL